MFNMSIKNNIKFPEFTFREDLEYIADRIFIPSMGSNIDKGVDLLGKRLPPNEPYTIKKKGNNRVLIDTGKLRSSFRSKSSKNKVIINLASSRAGIGARLQNEGVKSRHGQKFYNFFGVNELMENKAFDYLYKKLKAKCDAFNK